MRSQCQAVPLHFFLLFLFIAVSVASSCQDEFLGERKMNSDQDVNEVDHPISDGDMETDALETDNSEMEEEAISETDEPEQIEQDIQEEEEPACGVIDDVKHPPVKKIYNGDEEPTLYNLTAQQKRAVVAMTKANIMGVYTNICTGTLVAPHVVVTAAHCFDQKPNPSQIRITLGKDSANPDKAYDVQSYAVNPKYVRTAADPAPHDNAVIVLKGSVLDTFPDIQPFAMRSELLKNVVSEHVQLAGFGGTQDNDDNSLRYWAEEPIVALDDASFTVDGEGEHGMCFGDSGGPAFLQGQSGIEIIGTLSWGSETCLDKDHFSDLSADKDWLRAQIPITKTCGLVDEKGLCAGDMARWCDTGTLVQRDCKKDGQVCVVNEQGEARCEEHPCGNLSFQGECQGHVAVWCENNELRSRRCIPCGEVCGWVGEDLGYYCHLAIDGDTVAEQGNALKGNNTEE